MHYQRNSANPYLIGWLIIILTPLIFFGIGWVMGWVVQVIFLGEPYTTAIGYDLKTVAGMVLGGAVLLKYTSHVCVILIASLFGMT